MTELAAKLHELLCRENHTDGCDWYYGSFDDPLWSHKRFLKMAKALVNDTNKNPEKLVPLIDAMIKVGKS